MKKFVILFILLFPLFAKAEYTLDLTGNGTCTADSEYNGSFTCGNAFDNSNSTNWSSTISAFPHWLKYDFGASSSTAVTKITVKHLIDPNNHPKSFLFQGSNDNSNWTTAYEGQFADDETLQSFTFSNSNSYRYYRIWITDNWSGSTAVNFYEMEMMATVATSSTTTPASADMLVENGDMYIYVFFFSIILYLTSFIIVLKA